MPSRIPAFRVPLISKDSPLITTEWFSFLSSLFGFTGGGLDVTATLNFPSTAAGACSDLTVTVPGAVDGANVYLGVPNASVPANGSYFAWVSAADTVTVRFTNNSAGALDPASGTFKVSVARP